LTAFRWKLLQLGMQLPCLAFLLWSQVFPSLHPIQNALLLLGRPFAEVLQPLHIFLLLLGRKTPKVGIVRQRASLLLWRCVLVLPKPLPRMVPLIHLIRGLTSIRVRGLPRRPGGLIRSGSLTGSRSLIHGWGPGNLRLSRGRRRTLMRLLTGLSH
jgi:hypothetical protein